MTTNRRDFLKFVVAGSVAAGCPVDMTLLAAAAPTPTSAPPIVDGEHNEICHQVRDGHVFDKPAVSARYDVVIVGGGMSGLAAAYHLKAYNYLLLEKEEHWGGNAYEENYNGQYFATGSAFDTEGSEADQLAQALGLKQLPIDSPDPTILRGKLVANTWLSGLDDLPFDPSVRESFKKFRSDVQKMKVEANQAQLDAQPFSQYLTGYAPELKQWWDCYGPSNWGAKSDETSAFVGLNELQVIAAEKEPERRVTLPGGNGAITKALAEAVQRDHPSAMLGGATVVSVVPDKSGVQVTFVHQGQLKTVAARAAIMASPKFITARILSGIPDAQLEAMQQIRYIPYAVVNLVFDRPVSNQAYDTWCPGQSFTDFVVADWTVRNQPGYRQKYNILSCYTPLESHERAKLLREETCRTLAAHVLADFQKLLPGFNADPLEVHLYRRGHPMYMAEPGFYTKVRPAASRPLESVYFANTDSIAPISDIGGAAETGRKGAEWFEALAKGKSASARKPNFSIEARSGLRVITEIAGS
jgi:protoporphyrinogen/coproporphyrinogen III oxidase